MTMESKSRSRNVTCKSIALCPCKFTTMTLARLRKISLHEKIDTMRQEQLEQMLLLQQNQLDMIEK